MSTNILDLELLTPASVWLREGGQKSTVLWVTNESLPFKVQKQHPIQVVYVDEEGNVFSQSRDSFIERRTFFNVNPELESRLNNLLGFDESQMTDDGTDALGLDLIVTDSDSTQDSLDEKLAEEDALEAVIEDSESYTGEEAQSPLIYSIMEDTIQDKALVTAERLQQLTESYSQEPELNRGWILHKIVFRLESDVSAEDLFHSFSGGRVGLNALYQFTVNSEFVGIANEVVVWENSIGCYPYLMRGEQFVQIIVATSAPVPTDVPTEQQLSQQQLTAEAVEAVLAREAAEEAPSAYADAEVVTAE